MVSIRKLGIGGGIMFVSGIIILWGFPLLIRSQITKLVTLKPGNLMRKLIWTKLPFPLDFKVYLFNVTNPNEIEQGQKPKLQQVGPFFYDEYRVKLNLVDREEEDTVEYSMKTTWFFNRKKSKGLTGEEDLMLPNFMILMMAMMTQKMKPSAMPLAVKAIDSIFHQPESLFMKVKAKDVISDGLPIDCTVQDFAGSAACGLLKKNAKALMPDGINRYKFSFLGTRNDTVGPERMKVLRGLRNRKDVGRVVEFNGKSKLNIWPEDHCNVLNGTDATIFPPMIGPDDEIVSFGYAICRSITGHFSHRTRIKGIKTYRFTADLGDMSKNPEEKCFCPTPDTCLTKNLFDLTKCLGIPLIGSPPHFYDCEKNWLDLIDGLHPNQEDHEIVVLDLEQLTSAPLRGYIRVQLSMFVEPIEKFKLMKNFPEVLFPLVWIEEGLQLEDKYLNLVKLALTMIKIINFLKWLMIFGGIGMCVAAGGMYYKNHGIDVNLDVTNVSPENSKNDTKKSWPYNIKISTLRVAPLPTNLNKQQNWLSSPITKSVKANPPEYQKYHRFAAGSDISYNVGRMATEE